MKNKDNYKMLWNPNEIQIRKPSLPLGILMYVDYKYESILDIRRNKINKIKTIIKNGYV